MNKPVRVILVGEADETFKKLNWVVGKQLSAGKGNSEEIQLLKSIKQKIEFVKANPFYGDQIKKELIPKEYKNEYVKSNLFRTELAGFWRMIYTLRGDEIQIVAFVLDILSHPDYDKKFGYRKH